MTEILYHRIASQFYNRPLWLAPAAAETISAFLLTRMRQGRASEGGESDSGGTTQLFPATAKPDGSVEFHRSRASRFYGEYKIGDDGRPKPYRETPEGTAILTVVGELANRGAYVGASSGIITYEGFKYQIRQAARDERVKSILIDMESPGGEATGAFEAAAVVREAAQAKPVHAVVNGLAASAGYALISGATRIITMPTGVSGSIGVVLLHLDLSGQADALGIKPTFIFAGAHKVDGNPFEPLPKDVRARFQAEVSSYYDQFVETVAAGRRQMKPEDIRATEALTYKGQDAVDVGLADAIGTFEDVLESLSSGGSAGRFPTSNRRMAVAEDSNTKLEVDMTKITNAPGAVPDTPAAPAPVAQPAAPAARVDTTADLAVAFPGLVAAVRTEAATAERERILGIDAIAVPGHEALIRAAKADGKTTPAETAMQILQAEKQTRTAQAAAIQGVERVTEKVPAAPVASVRTEAERPAAATTPDAWRAEYTAQDDKGAALRNEFPTAESYVAYRNAESKGLVRRLVQRSS